jgi:hypothetical protein
LRRSRGPPGDTAGNLTRQAQTAFDKITPDAANLDAAFPHFDGRNHPHNVPKTQIIQREPQRVHLESR